MKKVYLTVLTVITVAAVIFGSMYYIGGIGFGWFRQGDSSKKVSFDEQYDKVSRLDVEASMLEVEICEGDAFRASYHGAERLKPTVTCEGSSLTVRQQKSGGIKGARLGDFMSDEKLTITIPRETVLEELALGLSMGEVKLNGVSASQAKINVNMGNVEADKVNADTLAIDADMGNVGIEESRFGTLTIHASKGNVEADALWADTVSLEADMGNVKLMESQFKDLSVDASMGNVTVKTKHSLEGFAMDVHSSMGNVRIGGEKEGDTYKAQGNAGSVSVKASMGSVRIN